MWHNRETPVRKEGVKTGFHLNGGLLIFQVQDSGCNQQRRKQKVTGKINYPRPQYASNIDIQRQNSLPL